MNRAFKHVPHYISLIGIFVFGLIGFYLFPYDRQFLIGLTVALSLSYLSWGIIHHFIHGELCMAIILEYLTIAILGSVIVISLIYRT